MMINIEGEIYNILVSIDSSLKQLVVLAKEEKVVNIDKLFLTAKDPESFISSLNELVKKNYQEIHQDH